MPEPKTPSSAAPSSAPPPARQPIETHPFAAVLPPKATVMMMGSFPPAPEKRCMDFHYPNYQNDMWRIYGLAFFGDVAHFQVAGKKRFDAVRIRAFLMERGIALCPAVRRARREQGNASDAFLTVIEPVNLAAVLPQVPHCRTLFATGGKAAEVLLGLLAAQSPKAPAPQLPKPGHSIPYGYAGRSLQLYRLPSTSRACPMPLLQKAQIWRAFFKSQGLLD